jgi:DNA polymerase I
MKTLLFDFTNVWIVICGVLLSQGDRLSPQYIAAATAEEPHTFWQVGRPELLECSGPPYPTGPRCMLVTIDANELVGCHLALGWPIPERIIDLTVEFRNATNGMRRQCGPGLAGALVWFGIPPTDGVDHCASPAGAERRLLAVARLFQAMRPSLDCGLALLRGRCMCAVARIEAHGIPVDVGCLRSLRSAWPVIRRKVFELTDQEFGVYHDGRFQIDAFEAWLALNGISWPRRADGALDLTDGNFRDMSQLHPKLRPLKELRSTLSVFDPSALEIGCDGRNRTPLRPFASRTGRNQPSSKASVLGSAAWVRNLVRPEPGKALAMIDWAQQEFGIAAALSGDNAMRIAYESGDPYLALAVRAGAAPMNATIATHAQEREKFKSCTLGVQYGMGSETLARITLLPEAEARQLISQHKSAFPAFWRWSDVVENQALFDRRLSSVFGWQVNVSETANPRFLRNFPMQANGAEMLRLACCLATERGITVCATLHDAILVEASEHGIWEAAEVVQQAMSEASSIVLDGFPLRSSVRVIGPAEGLGDYRGATVWSNVKRTIEGMGDLRASEQPVRQRNASCARAYSRPIYSYRSKKEDTNASD